MAKRILFILHTPPPTHGSSVVGKTIKDSVIINKAFECAYINLGTSLTIAEIGKNPLSKIWRYIDTVTQVLMQLLTNKPALCYLAITVNGPAFYKDSLIALLVKLFDVRIVYHFHNKGVRIRQHIAIYNFFYRKVFKNTYGILLSKQLYSDIEKYFTTERVYFCPNGIRNHLNLPNKKLKNKNLVIGYSSKVKILFLSNLIVSKGVFVLLDALKILHEKLLPFHCTLVGDEGDISGQQFNNAVLKMGLTQQITYVGKQYGVNKEAFFTQADIFVHPTYNDCLPLVLLEAMQFSLPVVSTVEGAIPSVVENDVTGLLVPQKDSLSLAVKLEKLIVNPALRKQMGQAGRGKYEKEFTLSVFEERMMEILSKIAKRY